MPNKVRKSSIQSFACARIEMFSFTVHKGLTQDVDITRLETTNTLEALTLFPSKKQHILLSPGKFSIQNHETWVLLLLDTSKIFPNRKMDIVRIKFKINF